MYKLNFHLRINTLVFMVLDAISIAIAYYMAYHLRFGGNIPDFYFRFFLNSLAMVLLVKLYFINDFRLYRGDLRYVSIYEVISLIKATVVSSLAVVLVVWASGLIHKLPRGVIFFDWCLTLIFIGGSRVAPRILKEGFQEPFWKYVVDIIRHRKIYKRKNDTGINALIYGAGDSGQMIAREMISNRGSSYNPVGFIDDSPSQKGKLIHGIEVLGDRSSLDWAIDKFHIEEIIISLPTAKHKKLQQIINICERTGIKTKMVPSLSEIVDGRIAVSTIRDIKVEDLLGRESVDLDTKAISGYLKNKRVLITGAGGSIGSELCRQVLKFQPEMIILFGRGENSIFEIYNELHAEYPDIHFPQVIGDVINKSKVDRIFDIYRPEIVFHAGADKHVPLMEMNPDEAVFNNIIGTKNVMECCDKHKVHRLICVSTDKAVNPTSMMGACKRIAEMLIQCRNSGHTKVMAVRFGNVLGSRGSVIPLFEKQIEAGGPVTVTDKNMERFLMTIPEASQLVIQAGAIGNNGESFVLDMGEPVKIDNLARRMIKLSGYKPEEDIDIVYSGIRPGEKLYEELSRSSEKQFATQHPKLIKIVDSENELDVEFVYEQIEKLRRFAIEMNYNEIYNSVRQLVPECELQRVQADHLSFQKQHSIN